MKNKSVFSSLLILVLVVSCSTVQLTLQPNARTHSPAKAKWTLVSKSYQEIGVRPDYVPLSVAKLLILERVEPEEPTRTLLGEDVHVAFAFESSQADPGEIIKGELSLVNAKDSTRIYRIRLVIPEDVELIETPKVFTLKASEKRAIQLRSPVRLVSRIRAEISGCEE